MMANYNCVQELLLMSAVAAIVMVVWAVFSIRRQQRETRKDWKDIDEILKGAGWGKDSSKDHNGHIKENL